MPVPTANACSSKWPSCKRRSKLCRAPLGNSRMSWLGSVRIPPPPPSHLLPLWSSHPNRHRLTARRWRFGWLDQIGRRWLGGGGGILTEPSQLILELPNGALQSLDLRLQDGHLLLQALAVGTGILATDLHRTLL